MIFAITEAGQKIHAYFNGRGFCPICQAPVIAKCGELNVWHWAHESLLDCDTWKYEPITQWHLDWQANFSEENREVVIVKSGYAHRADIVAKNGKVIEIQNSAISPEEIFERESFYNDVVWVINSKEFKHNLNFLRYKVDFDTDVMWVRFITANSKKENSFIIEVPYTDNGEIVKSLKESGIFYLDEKKEQWLNNKPIYGGEIPKEIVRAFTNFLIDEKVREIEYSHAKKKIYTTNFRWKNIRRSWLNNSKRLLLDLNNNFLFYINTLHDSGYGQGWIISKQDFIRKFKP